MYKVYNSIYKVFGFILFTESLSRYVLSMVYSNAALKVPKTLDWFLLQYYNPWVIVRDGISVTDKSVREIGNGHYDNNR